MVLARTCCNNFLCNRARQAHHKKLGRGMQFWRMQTSFCILARVSLLLRSEEKSRLGTMEIFRMILFAPVTTCTCWNGPRENGL